MNQELTKQAMAMFDSPEKWSAFLELVLEKDGIRNQWFQKLRVEANRIFATYELSEGWGFKSSGLWEMHWYLMEHGDRSISLRLDWNGLYLWCDHEFCDIAKIPDLLRTERFAPLLSCFSRLDKMFEGQRLATEALNFSFNMRTESNFDILAWYAGNITNEFLDQIAAKVNKFRKDELIRNLLSELNRQTKKQ